MVHSIAERSEAEGRSWSRLPYMRAEVRDSIRGWSIESFVDQNDLSKLCNRKI